MKRTLIAASGMLSLVGITGFAQVPAAALPTGKAAAPAAAAATPVGTRVNIGASLTDGNSETQTLNAEILNEGICPFGNDYSIGAYYNYGEASKDKTIENAKAFARLSRTFADPIYGYLKADILTDDISGIDYRLTVGPGLGANVIKNDQTTLGLELGLTWVKEKLTSSVTTTAADGTTSVTEASVEDDYVALRVADTFKQTLSATSRTWQSAEWLPDVSDFGRYLINAEIGIESDITEGVSLRVVAKDAYNSEPAAGRDDNDISLLAGFGLRL